MSILSLSPGCFQIAINFYLTEMGSMHCDIMNESEYVYYGDPVASPVRNSLSKSNNGEYIYDEDEEYVLECKDKTKVSDSKVRSISENKKPTHKETVSGIYNELDYELSPRAQENSGNTSGLQKQEKKWSLTKCKKIIIASLTGLFIAGGVAIAIVVGIQGKMYHAVRDFLRHIGSI